MQNLRSVLGVGMARVSRVVAVDIKRPVLCLLLILSSAIGGVAQSVTPPTNLRILPNGAPPPNQVVAASCAQYDVQAAVDSAPAGPAAYTVQLPACAATWAGAWPNYLVRWTNKNITLRGAGIGQTVITCGYCLYVTSTAPDSTYSHWRITGLTLNVTSPSSIAIKVLDNAAATVPNAGWRIDHIQLDYNATGSGNGIFVEGPTYGVIDNNIFNWKNQGILFQASGLHVSEYPSSLDHPQGGFMWSQPLDQGTANYIYIETNTITCTGTNGCAVYDTASGGHRAVIRNNTITAGFINHHWVRGNDWCGVAIEVYHNSFTGVAGVWNAEPIRLESGTGVVFENQIVGYGGQMIADERRAIFLESAASFLACDGTRAWDGNAGDPAAPGWPCLGQIGRAPGKSIAAIRAGDKQASAPLYLWRNGPEAGCRTGGNCTDALGVFVYDNSRAAHSYIRATPHPNGEVDYVLNGNTPKPGYATYTYPHPLTATP